MQGERAGSTLYSFLAEEDILEDAAEHAIESVLVWRINQEMSAQR